MRPFYYGPRSAVARTGLCPGYGLMSGKAPAAAEKVAPGPGTVRVPGPGVTRLWEKRRSPVFRYCAVAPPRPGLPWRASGGSGWDCRAAAPYAAERERDPWRAGPAFVSGHKEKRI